MTIQEFYEALVSATNVAEVEAALQAFEESHHDAIKWVPVGLRENNRGAIEVSGDPGRALVERLTNGIDAVLEVEHNLHNGIPECRTPKEAANAWLNVPENGLSGMTPVQRRALAQRVTIRLLPGEARESRTVEIIDRGTGLTPEQMPNTILSLNESNKLDKYYLAGTYGQGGSATLAVSKYTVITSRSGTDSRVGFTVVRFRDLPPESFKSENYVYLTLNGSLPAIEVLPEDFPPGTIAKHFGYDLSNYPSPLGPNSVYGLLNQILFDPVMPVWFDNRVHDYRRVIKGSRNALNGAVDEGDDERTGSRLSHNVRLYYTTIGDFGRIGIEYWVLERPTSRNKRPSAAFVNPGKPIILTINGQDHAELSHVLIRKEAELPYLTQRIICHIDCNSLTPRAKRILFVSNREDARRGMVLEMIERELVRALKSDDDLTRLNNEAREQGRREQDETAVQQMRREVARLLRIQGINVSEQMGGEVTAGEEERTDRPTHPRRPRPRPQPIEIHEPPTYIRIVWEENEEITFYPEQRRYIRIETDANSNYYNTDPNLSRINIMVSESDVIYRGSTYLTGGRMRAIFEGAAASEVNKTGTVRVELSRPGLPMLSDERSFRVVERPAVRPTGRRVTVPPFEVRPVDGPEDARWNELGWPDNTEVIASSAEMESGTLIIHYSTVFQKYQDQRTAFERREPGLADSFTKRYEIWLAVHSLLFYQDQQTAVETQPRLQVEEDTEAAETAERQERCRIATLSAMFAAREVQMPSSALDAE